MAGNLVVVGVQWGDEGKGKIVDWLSLRADCVVRFQGGPNAGHTLVVGGRKIVLHHIPSGILHEGKQCLIGPGAVVDPLRLAEEMEALRSAGVPVEERLRIADRCHLILPYHCALDAARERGERRIGTTGRGIGPAYEDKVARRGVRLAELASDKAEALALARCEQVNFWLQHWHRTAPVDPVQVQKALAVARKRLLPLAVDAASWMQQRLNEGARVLFEGAQGVLLDLDHGTYPFVTASSTVASAAASGAGVPLQALGEVIGICKAYATRVGEGPFPTELYDAKHKLDPAGKHLAQQGDEFGATTGRARRTGWFDAVAVRHAVRIGGVQCLALTKLDVLDGLSEVSICVGYRWRGEVLSELPASAEVLAECEPIYEPMPGWDAPTRGVRHASDLPRRARAYIDRIAELVGVPVRYVSTGPEREAVIELSSA